MNMPDHNIDELFRSKLGELEVTPSRNLWEGIAEGLEKKDKRRFGLMPWLSIAASVLVMITAGVLFIPQKTHVNTQLGSGSLAHGPVGKQPAVAVSQSAGAGQDAGTAAPTDQTAAANPAKAEPVQRSINNRADVPHQVIAKPNDAVLAMVDRTGNAEHPETRQTASLAGTVNIQIDRDVSEPPLPVGVDPVANIDVVGKTSTPAITAVQAPDKSAHKKHGIHNVGDLFNRVIARVDKRADKVLEFTETDDESDITGINLGFLAVKKDK